MSDGSGENEDEGPADEVDVDDGDNDVEEQVAGVEVHDEADVMTKRGGGGWS